MGIFDLFISEQDEDVEEDRCIVKLKTTVWADRGGLHQKKSLIYLKRQCKGFNILSEDVAQIGAKEVAAQIVNLDECKDGIYEVRACNQSVDWESGYVDNYDYKLIPLV